MDTQTLQDNLLFRGMGAEEIEDCLQALVSI